MTNDTRFLAADPAARRLFEIGQPKDGAGMAMAVYDLDSLEPVQVVRIAGADSGYGGRLAAVDELRHRLFVVVPLPVAPVDDAALRTALGNDNRGFFDTAARVFFGVAVVDTLSLRVLGIRSLADVVPAIPQDTSFANNAGLKALLYDAPSDKLYLETEDPTTRAENLGGPADHLVFIHQIDAGRLLDAGVSALDWSYAVTACPMALTGVGVVTSVMLRTANPPAVYLPCRDNPGESGGIARVNLRPGSGANDTTNFNVDFFAMPGALPGLVIADPPSGRLFLRVDSATGETGVWAFDAPSASWLGVTVTPGPIWGLGVDPSRRRLYSLSAPNHTGGAHVDVVLSATDAVPADQGLLTRFEPHADPVISRATVDPIRHRFVWSTFADYMVVEDQVSGSRATRTGAPDDNTLDVAEGSGTAANFFGGARAYGSRVRLVGGTRGVEQNGNSTIENLPLPSVPREIDDLLPAGVAEGTRDVHFARIQTATLSNGEASATAFGAQYDTANTSADADNLDGSARRYGSLAGPDGRDQAGAAVQQARAAAWPYTAAHCADFGGGTPPGRTPGATTDCSAGHQTVGATARYEHTGPDPVVVTRSTATISSVRDKVGGVVSEAHAEAQGIQIGGDVLIGKVTSTARSAARGRPGTAHATYESTIEDVKVRQPDGTLLQVCTSPCSPDLVADTINRQLGARVRVEFPRPDRARLAGTPGGYEALVVRDFYEQVNDRSVNVEPEIRLEVPAMEITVIADSRVRSRAVVSLAATSVESHYGIYLLAADAGPAPAPPRDLPARAVPIVLAPDGAVIALPPVAPGPLGSVLHKVTRGMQVILSTPASAARALGVWMLLVAPLVLAGRRRRYDPPTAAP